jgi:cold shock CspA family protein
MAAVARGVVIDYDTAVGLGTLQADNGRSYGFHCTQIADGSRDIDPGSRVEFDVVAGHLGRWEAVGIRRCGSEP